MCFAALVGLDWPTKVQITLHIISNMMVGSFLLARSADGLRSIAYPMVDEDNLLALARAQGTPIETMGCAPLAQSANI